MDRTRLALMCWTFLAASSGGQDTYEFYSLPATFGPGAESIRTVAQGIDYSGRAICGTAVAPPSLGSRQVAFVYTLSDQQLYLLYDGTTDTELSLSEAVAVLPGSSSPSAIAHAVGSVDGVAADWLLLGAAGLPPGPLSHFGVVFPRPNDVAGRVIDVTQTATSPGYAGEVDENGSRFACVWNHPETIQCRLPGQDYVRVPNFVDSVALAGATEAIDGYSKFCGG